jgi:hypothetical protein
MNEMKIHLDGEDILKGVDPKRILYLENPITVSALSHGMQSGLPSVAFIFDLPDGRKVVAHTSARLFITAAQAIFSKFRNDLLIIWREGPFKR